MQVSWALRITTSGMIITNPGSVYSEPKITVIGSGDITLMVGTTIVELMDISGSIVIDSALQEAYIGNTLMNDHMSGDFPVLKPGQNAVSWYGTVTRVVVKPNWRFLIILLSGSCEFMVYWQRPFGPLFLDLRRFIV